MAKEDLERFIKISPGFDKRSSEPGKNYGIGSAILIFVLRGKKGALTFNFSTGWNVASVGHVSPPLAYNVSSHRSTTLKGAVRNKCEYLFNTPCRGRDYRCEDELMKLLFEEGSEAVWTAMEKIYRGMR